MLEENEEIVRKAIEAFDRGDRDAWLNLHDEEVELHADPNWPESGTIRGPEAVWNFYAGLTDAWEYETMQISEVIEYGDDKLAAHCRRPVRGKASGVSDMLDYWCVATFRRGRILRQMWFADREAALEAARCSEVAAAERQGRQGHHDR